MKSTEDKLARIWTALKALSKEFTVDQDPQTVGTPGLARTAGRILDAWSRLNWIEGGIAKAVSVRTRALMRLQRLRRVQADVMMAGAYEDPELRGVRDKPSLMKAKVARRLGDLDNTIDLEEVALVELKALKEYLGILREQAKAAKEVSRQQVDLIRGERDASRQEGWS